MRGRTPDYLRTLWEEQDGKCYWLGVPLVLDGPKEHPSRANMDCLVPDGGYIVGNVVWSSRFAYTGRGNTPVEEFKTFLDGLRSSP